MSVCQDWLRRDQAENRDVATVRRIMAREVLPYIGEMQIEAVRKRDLIGLIDRVADRAPIRANRVLAHTKRMFRWAAARDLIEVNPAANIEKPTAERARDRVLSDAELVAIWHAAGRVGGAYGAGVRLLMLTGCRVAEVFEAKWSEIDGDALKLPAERSKSKEGRTVWLSPPALEVIGALPRFAGCDWLLTASGRNPFRAMATSKDRLDKELAGEEMPEWRHHDFRRTLATNLQRMGVRLEVIETVLGPYQRQPVGYRRHLPKASFRGRGRRGRATVGRAHHHPARRRDGEGGHAAAWGDAMSASADWPGAWLAFELLRRLPAYQAAWAEYRASAVKIPRLGDSDCCRHAEIRCRRCRLFRRPAITKVGGGIRATVHARPRGHAESHGHIPWGLGSRRVGGQRWCGVAESFVFDPEQAIRHGAGAGGGMWRWASTLARLSRRNSTKRAEVADQNGRQTGQRVARAR